MKLKKIIYGLLTVSNIKKMGYFIPYRYAGALTVHNAPYPWIQELFIAHSKGNFLKTLKLVTPYIADLKKIKMHTSDATWPRWGQDWFPGLDAAIAYGLVRAKKPKQILEVGSGHSTRFVLKAIKDGAVVSTVTCVDPAPRATLKGLNLNLIKLPIQLVDPKSLPKLQKGDMLIIDSSHLAVCGSDVDWIINRLIPTLPSGVFVHFHDIFLPDSYPKSWLWREYNEQVIVAALMAGHRLEPIFSSYFTRKYAPKTLKQTNLDWIELMPGAVESSLWLVTK
jgi:hypothetical protein